MPTLKTVGILCGPGKQEMIIISHLWRRQKLPRDILSLPFSVSQVYDAVKSAATLEGCDLERGAGGGCQYAREKLMSSFSTPGSRGKGSSWVISSGAMRTERTSSQTHFSPRQLPGSNRSARLQTFHYHLRLLAKGSD